MTWRVILRVGLTQDNGSVVRNTSLEPSFRAMGLQNTATGTWEANHVTEASAVTHLSAVLTALANPTTVPGAAPAVRMKHLWVYLDNQPNPAPFIDEDDA